MNADRMPETFAADGAASPAWVAEEKAANEALMNRVNDTGQTFLSHTKLDGPFVLLLAIGNFRTKDDVALAWELLRSAAKAAV